MANFFDDFRMEQFNPGGGSTHGAVDFVTDTIHAALIDTGTDDPDLALDQDWANITAAQIGTDTALTSKTWTIATNVGTFDAADVTFSTVSGATAEELVLFKWSGADATSILICQWDSGDVTGLPVTPNGGDIVVAWNASGIFSV
jgi:hypothetical protein